MWEIIIWEIMGIIDAGEIGDRKLHVWNENYIGAAKKVCNYRYKIDFFGGSFLI